MKKSKKPELPAVTSDFNSRAAEAYRKLRTNIQFAEGDRAVHKILVTAPAPRCGSTTTLVNLGISFSLTGARVLLVDSDLRMPTLHSLFNFRNDQGLTAIGSGTALNLEMAVHKCFIENLYILGSGQKTVKPAELLSSEGFREEMRLISASYDYILFDSPPINAAADALILSKLVDATLFVIRYGRVKDEEAAYALEQLKKVRANVLGAVLNALPADGGAYYYEYSSET